MFSVIRVILPLVIQVICSQWFAPKTLNYLAFQSWFWVYLMKVIPIFWFWVYLIKVIPILILSIPDKGYSNLDFEYTWWRLFQAFQSFDFEYTWWRLFQVFQSFDFEYTWWRLFWVYLMKVILSIPDEGYFECTWWRLFWAYLMKVILSIPD